MAYQVEDGYSFYNAFGQCFKVVGLNDKWAAEDAEAYIASGRPFGRIGMRRLANTFGVTVSFAGRRKEDDELFSDIMEDVGY